MSMVHGDVEIDATLAAADRAMADLSRGG